MNIFTQFFKNNPRRNKQLQDEALEKEMMRRESEIGRELFGPIPKGHKRDFFCMDAQSWVWHEEWKDAQGVLQTKTVRYMIRPGSVVKSKNGGEYVSVGLEEAKNLLKAVEAYNKAVPEKVYGRRSSTPAQ